MTLAYPKERHTRSELPREYKDYRSYKPYLRSEFSRRCVYCRAPDTWRGQASFGADHYRPQDKFPELGNVYSNLFYCCNQCNSRKSNYWPDSSKAKKDFIPNPCDHRMFDHLRYADGEVVPRSAAGEFTIEHLDLNDPAVVGYRQTVLHMLEVQENYLDRCRSNLNVLEAKYVEGRVLAADYDQMKTQIQVNLKKTENAIAMLSGRDPVHA